MRLALVVSWFAEWIELLWSSSSGELLRGPQVFLLEGVVIWWCFNCRCFCLSLDLLAALTTASREAPWRSKDAASATLDTSARVHSPAADAREGEEEDVFAFFLFIECDLVLVMLLLFNLLFEFDLQLESVDDEASFLCSLRCSAVEVAAVVQSPLVLRVVAVVVLVSRVIIIGGLWSNGCWCKEALVREDLQAALVAAAAGGGGGVARMKFASPFDSRVLPRPNWQSYSRVTVQPFATLLLPLVDTFDTGSWLKAYKSASIRATMKGESFIRLTMSPLFPLPPLHPPPPPPPPDPWEGAAPGAARVQSKWWGGVQAWVCSIWPVGWLLWHCGQEEGEEEVEEELVCVSKPFLPPPLLWYRWSKWWGGGWGSV